MWKWFKNLFKKDKKISPDIKYLNLTKGDLKKLKAQGKIKSIYNINK